jgi:hypothetical protein
MGAGQKIGGNNTLEKWMGWQDVDLSSENYIKVCGAKKN